MVNNNVLCHLKHVYHQRVSDMSSIFILLLPIMFQENKMSPSLNIILEKSLDFLNFLLPEFKNEGKSYVVIGIGCTGGMHRSVAIAEAIGNHLMNNYNVSVRHRDVKE